jgi:TPR repeat protein
MLGNLYLDGHGVAQNYVEARQWFEKAAAQGDANAQNNLGVLYGLGHGVQQNYVRAYMWWSLSVAHSTGEDQKLAAGNLDIVARKLTPGEIAEAQRLAQQCQVQQFKGC